MTNLTTCPVCAYVRDAAVTVCHECQGIDVITPLTLTLADASQLAIVRRALESSLLSGMTYPRFYVGPFRVRRQGNGQWSVRTNAPHHNLTSDQAVALIVATARGTL